MEDVFSHIQTQLQKTDRKPLIVLCGPTAVGKTATSIAVAKEFDGEIISVDSRQVYKEMDIATDKITEDAMQNVPHHMLDVVDPDVNFSLADFVKNATKIIADVHARKKIPMLVGGTVLYSDAIAQGYVLKGTPPNEKLRERYKKMATEKGKEAVYALLSEKDPKAAEKIHPNNLRYVIRALEKLESGESLEDEKKESPYNVIKIGLFRPREELYERINKRVEEQIDEGIIEELKNLLKKYPRELSSMTSLGYKEYFPYLDGEKTIEEAIATLQKNTRNYAKRQLTWLRKDNSIQWFDAKTLQGIHTERSAKSPTF